jgi:hypothetical protein
MSKRQGGFESTNVIFIDAGNNSDVFYQCVNFARQYGLDIKKVLEYNDNKGVYNLPTNRLNHIPVT